MQRRRAELCFATTAVVILGGCQPAPPPPEPQTGRAAPRPGLALVQARPRRVRTPCERADALVAAVPLPTAARARDQAVERLATAQRLCSRPATFRMLVRELEQWAAAAAAAGELDRVVRLRRALVRLVPTSGRRLALARALVEVYRDQEAARIFEALGAADDGRPAEPALRPQTLGAQASAARRRHALAMRPSPAGRRRAAALYRLGVAALGRSDFTNARQAFERSVALQPHPDALARLSRALEALGDRIGARAARARRLGLAEALAGLPVRSRPTLGQTSPLYALAVSPRGDVYATGGSESMIKLWNLPQLSERRDLAGHRSPVHALAFAPSGQVLASGSSDRTVKLWDVATGQVLRTLPGHTDEVSTVAFAPSGQVLASGSRDGTVKLWDVATWRLVRTLQAHRLPGRPVYTVAFSPDGRLLAAGAEGMARLWDVTTGRVRLDWLTGQNLVLALAFAPSGRVLALSGSDRHVQLIDLATHRLRLVLHGHVGWVESLGFAPAGQVLASGSKDGTVKLWPLALDRQPQARPRPQPGVFADGPVRRWNATAGPELRAGHGNPNWVVAAAFTAGGRLLLTGSWTGTVKLWNVSTGRALRARPGHGGAVTTLAWDPSGRSLATGCRDLSVKLWDGAVQGKLRAWHHRAGFAVTQLAFSASGRVLASMSEAGDAWLMDVATGRMLRRLNGVTALAWAPTAPLLALGASRHHTVELVDAATGRERGTLFGHGAEVTTVAFAPTGLLLASGSTDRVVKLWDLRAGTELWALLGHQGPVSAVAFGSAGRLLASGSDDLTVKLWEVTTGRLRSTLRGHAAGVTSVAFAPMGRILASGSWDQTVKLWDVASGRVLRTLSGHQASVSQVAFAPSGRVLASGSFDRTVKLWDVASGRLLATLVATSDQDWIVLTPDGYVDGFQRGRAFMSYALGADLFGASLAWDRFHVPGLLGRLLRGDPAFRLEALRALVAGAAGQPRLPVGRAAWRVPSGSASPAPARRAP